MRKVTGLHQRHLKRDIFCRSSIVTSTGASAEVIKLRKMEIVGSGSRKNGVMVDSV